MSRPLANPVSEARRIIDAAEREGLVMRSLGGVAVALRSPSGAHLPARVPKDIDLATPARGGAAAARLLESLGYAGDEMFNALHGARRQSFRDPYNGRDLDLFVGSFSMCHAIPIAARLHLHRYTIPIGELLLTKLQIVHLTDRDELDIYALCLDHDLLADPGECEVIAAACAADWGLWRTCTATIGRCRADLDGAGIEPATRALLDRRLAHLEEQIGAYPKGRAWRLRSLVGERWRWFAEPEEEPGR